MINKEKKWYIIQSLAGQEQKVAKSIKEYARINNMLDSFGEILIPSEEVVEIKSGQKRKVSKNFFPGYVLIEMHMDDNSWHMVKNVPKVLSFIGGKSDKPIAISDKEFSSIMKRVQENKDSPKSKSLFEPGELICVKEGPFKDYSGTVEVVDYDKNRVKVAVSIFGRATPVELDFSQVEKSE